MATAQTSPEQRLLLEGEPWEAYARMLRVFDERRHLRITYDRGALEIMTISPEHEWYKSILGRIVIALTEELQLPIACYGSMTLRRRRIRRGLEPDQCYWIENEAKVRNIKKFDWRRDPPPDLILEIDITRSSLDRMSIYAAMRVPEVWCHDGSALKFYVLGPDGKYAVSSHSRVFPGLTPDAVSRFLTLREQMDENALVREFRTWIRQRIADGWK
jgi:Uma2 family endonuclease